MFNRISRSWTLFKSSFRILMGNKKLLIFPAIATSAALGAVLIIATAGIIAIASLSYQESKASGGGFDKFMANVHQKYIKKIANSHDPKAVTTSAANKETNTTESVLLALPFAILYLISMFVATFFNVAFYSEIIQALGGGNVSILRGFKFACSKIVPILMWSLFAGIVGYIIKAISERLGIIGNIVMSLIGVVWSVAAVFVIPVIICKENSINPFGYLKESALTIKKTWGEGLVGYVGFSGLSTLVGFASFFLFLLPLGTACAFIFKENALIPILGVAVAWFLLLVLYSYIASVAGKIYLCSLYVYATEGVVPEHFTSEDMNSAWKIKK